MRVKYEMWLEIRSDVGAHTFATKLGEFLAGDPQELPEVEYVHGVKATWWPGYTPFPDEGRVSLSD